MNQQAASQPPASQLPANQPAVSLPPLLQAPGQAPLPAPSAEPHGTPRPITATSSGQPAHPQLSTQTSLAAAASETGPAVKKGDGIPAAVGGSKEDSPKADEGAGTPSKAVKMMSGILEVLVREVLNYASTAETRDAAHTCLQIMAEGTRKTVFELLASSAPKIAANLPKRRLVPFKSLPTQMGTVAALTYCLKQHPTLLTLGVEICLIASDAFQVLELGDQQLLNLIPASRSVTTESVGKLRRVCMEFLAACISWEQFRS